MLINVRNTNSTCIRKTLHSLLLKFCFSISFNIQGFISSCISPHIYPFGFVKIVTNKVHFLSIITLESIFHDYIWFFNLCNANYSMYYIVQLNRHHLTFAPFNFNMSFPLTCLYEDHICSTISMCDLFSLAISCSSTHFVVELLLFQPMCCMLFSKIYTHTWWICILFLYIWFNFFKYWTITLMQEDQIWR